MKLVFVVAMADSVHTARWLSQFSDQHLSILLFPSTPHRKIHPIIKDLIRNNKSNKLHVRIAPGMRHLALPLWLMDRSTPLRIRSRILKHLIDAHRPAILHGMETQNAGYLIAETLSKLQKRPKVYLSIWGSDLVWFRQFAYHRSQLRRVLSNTDALSTECKRDIEIAKTFGFKGEVLPTIPASGGIDLDHVAELGNFDLPSRRSNIVVKGYSGFVGGSLTALRALEQMSDELESYEIHVYSASMRTRWRARRMRKKFNSRIVTYKKHALSHSQVISMLGKARLSISVSLSDGFPGSLREAMVTGCFPIESKYSCGNEWATAGKSALFVDPSDISEIISAIRFALNEDEFVDQAAKTNYQDASDKFSTTSVSTRISDYYFNAIGDV